MADFKIRRLALGDVALMPRTDAAIQYVREYRARFGEDSLVGMSIYVERSRDFGRVAAALRDLRDAGFSWMR